MSMVLLVICFFLLNEVTFTMSEAKKLEEEPVEKSKEDTPEKSSNVTGSIVEQLETNYEKFQSYNDLRLSRLQEIIIPRKRPIFRCLSFLLNINNSNFPGYVDFKETPRGIENFSLTDAVIEDVNKVFSDKMSSREALEKMIATSAPLKSLMLMGSVGTIAQTYKSDFDFWVCLDKKDFSDKELDALQKKLTGIEKWAEDRHKLEVHFFITDIEMVRNNDFGAADEESAGSSQARLLKEEFYRTTVLIEGQLPFWWLVPSGANDEIYNQYKKELAEGSYNVPIGTIDLGNLDKISTEEFFGAAIWQICKAIESPYKSTLKMAMLELFLDPNSEVKLLCNIIKERVQAEKAEENHLKTYDPYTVMFDTIRDYYNNQNEAEVCDLLESCFYIKCGYEVVVDMEGNFTGGKKDCRF